MTGLPLPVAAQRDGHRVRGDVRAMVRGAPRRRRLASCPVRRANPHAVGARTIDDVLVAARAHLTRLEPTAVADLLSQGRVVLVDTRPATQRDVQGEVPGAVVVERNVLEWRLDPASASRLPLAHYDLPVVVMCAQGYSSSLAARSLRDLGVFRATDMVGGFEAWRSAGLPVTGGRGETAR